MSLRGSIAILMARVISFGCKLAGKQGVTMAGKFAMKVDPNILRDLALQVKGPIIVTCGTNGKTTTNNLIASALEAEGKKVICNRTGSNMLMGVAAAFVLNASLSGRIDADAAVIEIDEASTVRVFPHFRPDYMVLTNLFRDQLDRYGEIDITMDLLSRAMKMAPDMKVIVNGDDPLSASLAMDSGNPYVTYGISENCTKESSAAEIREGQFCRRCGTRLAYDFYHYSQLGVYRCPKCGFSRPAIDFDARRIDMTHGLAFDILKSGDIVDNAGTAAAGSGKTAAGSVKEPAVKHIDAAYRGFYNIYNILAVYAALRTMGVEPAHFDEVLANYRPENGRNELFQIGDCKVLLNLAKNPAGFNQNIGAVLEDREPKDLIIVINDNAQDGTDISWLWDVDFDRLDDPAVNSITVSGIRCEDMRLRLKYVDIPSELITDVKEAVKKKISEGSRNLYVLVNYTALYNTHIFLKELERSASGSKGKE